MKLAVITLFTVAAIAGPAAAQDPGVTKIRLSVETSLLSGGQGAKGRVDIARDPAKPVVPVVIRLSSNQPSLVRFTATELTIPATDSSAVFEMGTSPTPIRTPVTLKATVSPTTLESTFALDLVPALLQRVTANKTSIVGTKGQVVALTAELKAPAPPGGIELYLSPYIISSLDSIKMASPIMSTARVAAGSRTVTIPIPYNDIINALSDFRYSSLDFNSQLETQTRRYDLVVAVEPQDSKFWSAIPDRAIKVGFDVVPLRISSFTVQPTSGRGGSEALASFVLSAPPGAGERVLLNRNSTAVRLALAGASCAVATSSVDMELTAGITNYAFKVCPQTVATTTSVQPAVTMRSGTYTGSFSVLP